MNKIYYGNRPVKEDVVLHGITQYTTQTVYINEELKGFSLKKAIRHELTHIYLWETGQQAKDAYTEEDICDIMSVAAPIIEEKTNEIVLRLKEGKK